MEWTVILLVVVITFVAAYIQGLSGFGFPLFAVPILSFFLPITIAVPITTLLGIPINLLLVKEIPGMKPKLRETLILLITGCLTIPLGVWCLKFIDTNYIKIFLGVVIIVCTLLMLKGLKLDMKHPTAWNIGIGLVCGFLLGLANIAGPLLVLYLSNLNIEKKVFRGITILIFLTMGVANLVTSVASGLVTSQVMTLAAFSLPLLLVGTWLGAWTCKRVNEGLFRKLSLGILFVTGFSVLVPGISAFFAR